VNNQSDLNGSNLRLLENLKDMIKSYSMIDIHELLARLDVVSKIYMLSSRKCDSTSLTEFL
jgi:hypothetical protein